MSPPIPASTLARLAQVWPVSAKAESHLAAYAQAVETWNARINLVAASTVAELWERHILDSWQILPLLDRLPPGPVADFGSGAGFPGLVIAIATDRPVTMVDSAGKKASFLSTISAQLGLKTTVISQRIEALPALLPARPAIVTARACASLDQLCAWAFPVVIGDGDLVFLKGKSWQSEIETARKSWSFDCDISPSITNAEARIIHLSKLRSKDG